jgi:hypothetical protein
MVGTHLEAVWFCRGLNTNDLTGAMPTELGRLMSLTQLYVPATLHFALNDGGF